MRWGLTENVSLVVGASSGIGRALANALARERGRVALVGRNPERLTRVAREVEMFGGEAMALVSDVRDTASVHEALGQVMQTWGRVDTAFLSSGIAESVDLKAFKAQALEEIIQTNVMGVAHWIEALQPVMVAQEGGGTIAVISSLSADRAFPGGGAGYSASKAAVSQLCDGLRAGFARQGITLVTVSPGFVQTPMTAGMGFLPALVTAEQSAVYILDGLAKGRRVIRFPRAASVAMGMLRLLPPALLDKLYREQA